MRASHGYSLGTFLLKQIEEAFLAAWIPYQHTDYIAALDA
jgi:hypothetical protein